jgi:hypothetical protein
MFMVAIVDVGVNADSSFQHPAHRTSPGNLVQAL